MDPQTLAVLGRLTAYGPWAIVLGLLIMNLHRFTDAYDAVSATRLRNRAAKQTLNCEVSEAQRDRALAVFQGLTRSTRLGNVSSLPNATSEAPTKTPAKASTRSPRAKPS
ncbi:hypothetical protein [Amycolatopsis sp. DG1A-15b]|uniref:hypothetical protein n=1 Tax=Amycolatopsis sp. DG1A-15b TaxID=3052846 RepID=UPI00255BFF18|nr:hypothetical protein [Amycolatopsis sp. DG1A-15b]WIX92535.1 hypothetical protein QRY02_19680 [Amycolatopsis sp. DG1A-15b]